MRIEVEAKIILTVPNAGNRSAEDIVLLAEQHVNEKASTFVLDCYKNCADNSEIAMVDIRLHVDGRSDSIVVQQSSQSPRRRSTK